MLKSIAAGGVAFLAGCVGDSPEDSDTKHWIGAQGSEAPNYNVFRITDTTSGDRVTRVMDPAYVFDENDEFVPRLIRDYEVNDDYTEWTFTLTEHGEWSDPYGAMTAEDWVYSITEILQGEDNWANASMADDWRMSVDEVPDGFEAADEDGEQAWFNVEETGEFEFTVEMPLPFPGFLEEPILWGFQEVIPKDLAEEFVEDQDGDAMNEDDEIQELSYTGNLGAFTVEVLEIEARMNATRNDDYYLRNYDGFEDAPFIEEWTYQVMSEESTRLSALQSGEITHSGVPPRRAEEFDDDIDDVNIFENPTVYCQSMFYNMRDDGWEGLQVPEVRQALTMAVDREELVEEVQYGYATVAHTLSPEYSDFYDNSEVVEWDYDPDAARQQLEDNLPSPYGYSDGRVVDGDGEEVVLNFVFSDSADDTELTARIIQEEMDEIGLEVELDEVPWNTMLDDYLYKEPGEAQEWDFMSGIGRNAYPRAPEATEGFWRPGESANGYGYDDPHGVADMLSDAARMADADERQSQLAEVFGILSEDQPWNFLYFPEDIEGYRDHVEPSEDSSIAWEYDINRWEIEQEQ
ncbi:peptide/nickel transport system substrate-binding protein [Natronorubrum sediminis]|uniref:Peptide/nickel transport system substrate-binding protein n=2 Tax=Natronorubrum sediminis TaxID=640943 RepID=A0A1H6FPJ3_9EURY|nr:peptide/nickel transport system substrate-binding protein [Natronorubrum sediminis]